MAWYYLPTTKNLLITVATIRLDYYLHDTDFVDVTDE